MPACMSEKALEVRGSREGRKEAEGRVNDPIGENGKCAVREKREGVPISISSLPPSLPPIPSSIQVLGAH